MHIRLPPEDPHASRGDCNGRLLKATYGTKRGTLGFGKITFDGSWNVWGCWSPKLCQGVYFDRFSQIVVATHVDDFLVVGNENVLKEFNSAFLK